jgi:hypothetical protein
MAASYSLILSKGTHLVDESTRRRVLEAIEQGERVIEIPVDRYHDGTTTTATVVTAHVIALFAHEALDEVELPANVTALVRRA